MLIEKKIKVYIPDCSLGLLLREFQVGMCVFECSVVLVMLLCF